MPTINFIFATDGGGAAAATPISLGTVSNGGSTSDKAFYVQHDSVSDLDNCGFYIQPYLGTGYVGLNGESPDYLEILGWGTWSDTRGLMVNMDAAATATTYDISFGTSTGALATNAVQLDTRSILSGTATGTGHFPVGDTSHFTLRLAPPVEATAVGLRQFSLLMKYEV